jgi:hypothetical protein
MHCGGDRPPIRTNRSKIHRLRRSERTRAAAGVEAPEDSIRDREPVADCEVCWDESYITFLEIGKFFMDSSFLLK